MNKKIFHLITGLVPLIILFEPISAQQITGNVKTGPNGSPLPFVTVAIPQLRISTITDINGEYNFGSVSEGATLTISVNGRTDSKTIKIKAGSNIVNFWTDAATDYDGNSYNAVEIGTQVWMAENLKTTRFNDFTAIPNYYDGTIITTDWNRISDPSYCWYNDDQASYKSIYGAIYNLYAVRTDKLCPWGWHVPSHSDWTVLTDQLGGRVIAGGLLKEAGLAHWNSPNAEATNETGFSALPAGRRSFSDGSFSDLGISGFWWSSTDWNANSAWARDINYNLGSVNEDNSFYLMDGLSIRCLKDAVEPPATTAGISNITSNEAISGGYIPIDGFTDIIQKGVCWSTSPNPTTTDNATSDGTGTGFFISNITGLIASTKYYLRAYAIKSNSEIVYGNDLIFETLPFVQTREVTDKTPVSATSGGEVQGGTAVNQRGVCWSTNHSPTIEDSYVPSGSGNGTFITTVTNPSTNLVPNTQYYLRAYATNSTGTVYGNEITFTTQQVFEEIHFNDEITYGEVEDIEGNTYRTVQIGNQIWMAENLRTKLFNDGTEIAPEPVTDDNTWIDLTSPGYCWFKNDMEMYGNIFGAIYNWHTVNTGKLCPIGWHVPSNSEFSTLRNYLSGGEEDSRSQLREVGFYHWVYPNENSNNLSGFTALPAGYRRSTDGMFGVVGFYSHWWSTSEYSTSEHPNTAWFFYLRNTNDDVTSMFASMVTGFSVRCVMDNSPTITTNPVQSISSNSAEIGGTIIAEGTTPLTERGICWSSDHQNPTIYDNHTFSVEGSMTFTCSLNDLTPKTHYYVRAYATNNSGTTYGNEISFRTFNPETISDHDGNIYNTVTIGGQVWMVENLKVTSYYDGTQIDCPGEDIDAWKNNTSGAYSWYENEEATFKDPYGALYNWYAVNSGKLCPDGWHVPTDSEWTDLINYIGGSEIAGGKLKETGFLHWNEPNEGATNESGFTAVGSGLRDPEADWVFSNLNATTHFWSSSENYVYGIGRSITWVYANISPTLSPKNFGASVRCIMNYSGFTVTNTNDNGSGSLRKAIVDANSNPGMDDIIFNIDGPGPHTIMPSIPLPNITESVIIDGYTQQGSSRATENSPANLQIELDGSNIAENETWQQGLTLWGGSSIIRGLMINNFRDAGIHIEGHLEEPNVTPCVDNIIEGNFIGVDYNGKLKGDKAGGIRIWRSTGNIIGGDNPENRNIIAGAPTNIWGEGSFGILILLPESSGNIVKGNYIGIGPDGETGLNGPEVGIRINEAAHDNIIGPANVISGNSLSGIQMEPLDNRNAYSNTIIGNYIGTNQDGSKAVPNGNGIRIFGATGNKIGGAGINDRNIISGNSEYGIDINISGNFAASGNLIQGNFIGLNSEGIKALGNGNDGIRIFSKDNIIGGPGNLSGNKISGNGGDGIHIVNSEATGNLIIGNLIGTDSTGKSKIGNTNAGIRLNTCNYNTIGGSDETTRNIISGNGIGIVIQGPIDTPDPSYNKVLGNFIGTDITGEKPLGNGQGIFIGAAHDNIIGGSYPGEGNLISGNNGDSGNFGILIIDDAGNNSIKGNMIGTNVTGTDSLPNMIGIHILRSQNNFIGGNAMGEGNLISGNRNDGILIYGGWVQEFDENGNPEIDGNGNPVLTLHVAENNSIQGNFIGTDISGLKPLGNSNGIRYDNNASNNLIGGMGQGEGNIIAFNRIAGVACGGAFNPGTGNSILSNSIHSNIGLGIDLGIDSGNAGVTENDDGDTDTGNNNLQNYPVIEEVSFSPGKASIKGTLNSEQGRVFLLQFFVSKVSDDSYYGEGQTFLGNESITTDDNGHGTFTKSFDIKSAYGQVITATATDPDGNTSEFSKVIGGLADQEVGTGWPLRYKYNVTGAEEITDGSDITALKNAFQTWSSISTANIIKFENDISGSPGDGSTTAKYADASDGVNLVSFVDDQYDWVPGVLAYAAKTVKMDADGETGKIIDADIIVNPQFKDMLTGTHSVNDVGTAGYYDIQSIITHEIGHVLGLVHSGVTNATMFFWLQDGTTIERTPEPDDIAWASYKYPNDPPDATHSTIAGNITYGYGGDPVAGALVTAENASSGLSFHSYSDAAGDYTVPVLAGQSYYIKIQPLDGDVNGYPMTPANISSYIYSNTIYTDYPDEYYNLGENDGSLDSNGNPTDDGDKKDAVTSGANGIDFITNKDVVNPYVVSITPNNELPVEVLPDIIIRFSEPVDLNSFTDVSCYLESGGTMYYGGVTQLGSGSDVIIFTPNEALPNDKTFSLHLLGLVDANTIGITDVKGNPLNELDQPYSITTVLADNIPPTITGTLPKQGVTGVFVTDNILVSFSEPMNKQSVQDGFSLTASGSADPVQGAFSWNGEYTNMTFDPSESLSEDKTYSFTISGTSEDLNGIQIGSNNSLTFTTVTSARPGIVYRGPSDGKTGVSVTTPVVVDFTEPINPATVTSGSLALTLNGVPVTGTFEFLNNDSRVVFRPQTDLEFEKTYTISLSETIKDVSDPVQNLNLEGKPSSTFTTAAEPVSPYIYYVDPPSGTVGDVVMIAGEGFDPVPANNRVNFGDVTATVKSSTLGELVCTVPEDALPGMVTVTVDGETSVPGFYFYVIPEIKELPANWAVSNVNTGSNSRDVAISADATTAYVTNPGSNTVSVIDMQKLTIAATINVGSTPLKIDINPAGTRAYVTNYGSHTISVIDLINNVSLKEINVGINPYGVVVTPDGNHVYVANYSSENLSVIDVNPNSGGFDHVVANVNTGANNKDITVTADAGLVLVAGDNGLNIVNINPGNKDFDCFNCVVANANSGTKTSDVSVMADATYAIVSTEDGLLLVVDVLPSSDFFGTAVASANSGSQVKGITAQGEALYIYVTTANNEVQIFKVNPGGVPVSDGSYTGTISLSLAATIPDAGNEGIVIDTRNERILAISSGTGDEIEGLNVIQLYEGPANDKGEIGSLMVAVQRLINGGILKRTNGNELISFLMSAIDYLDAGKTKNAINKLNTFVVKMQDYVKSRQIPAALGQPLIDIANIIISRLKGTKAADSEINPDLSDAQATRGIISETSLGLIYPNPSRESVTINYDITDNERNGSKVTLRIYDVLGRMVGELANGVYEPGHYSVTWNGYYENGRPAPKGIYYIQFIAGDVKAVKQVMLVR